MAGRTAAPAASLPYPPSSRPASSRLTRPGTRPLERPMSELLYAVDAERAFLGVLVESPYRADEAPWITPDVIGPGRGHTEILAAVRAVAGVDGANHMHVLDALARRGTLMRVGDSERGYGGPYLHSLMQEAALA